MRIAPAALASMLFVVPGVARASGLSVARFGAEHGHPMTTTAPAIFYNPAGIAGSEGGHLYGDLVLAWRRATYDRATSDTVVPPGADGTNTGRATLFNVLAEPFVGATYRLG